MELIVCHLIIFVIHFVIPQQNGSMKLFLLSPYILNEDVNYFFKGQNIKPIKETHMLYANCAELYLNRRSRKEIELDDLGSSLILLLTYTISVQ